MPVVNDNIVVHHATKEDRAARHIVLEHTVFLGEQDFHLRVFSQRESNTPAPSPLPPLLPLLRSALSGRSSGSAHAPTNAPQPVGAGAECFPLRCSRTVESESGAEEADVWLEDKEDMEQASTRLRDGHIAAA